MSDFEINENDILVKYHGNACYVTIPEQVKEIGDAAFRDCTDLIFVKIPEGVTNIGHSAFRNCKNLMSISIPKSVEYIGNQAFSGTAWLKQYPKDLVVINQILIRYKGREETLILPEMLVCIKDHAFDDCPDLKQVIYHHICFSPKEIREINSCFMWMQAIRKFLDHPENQISVQGVFLFVMRLNDTELLRKLLETGKFAVKKNIRQLICLANEKQAYEMQIMLMNYQAEHFPEDTAGEIRKRFGL